MALAEASAALRRCVSHAYAYAPIRSAIRRYGPGYWRTPRRLRRRSLATASLRKFAIWTGDREQFSPGALGHPPTPGHRITGRRHVIPAPFVALLSDVTIVDRFAVPVTPQGTFLLTPFRDQIGTLSRDRHGVLETYLARHGSTPVRRSEDLVFSLVGRLSANYYHWIVDLLPQLQWIETVARQIDTRPRLLVSVSGPAFQRQSLAALGWDDAIVEWPDDGAPMGVARLLACPTPGAQIAPSPSGLRWLRDRLAPQTDDTAGRGIYIARPREGWRAVANAAEVEKRMSELGLIVMDPAQHTLHEQIQLFRAAPLIVGQHGAGLANLVFARQGTVVELCGRYGGAEYYGMASALGLPYRGISCLQHGDDIDVDIPHLAEVIASVQQHAEPPPPSGGPL